MKATLKFTTIEFDNIPGLFDYPMNLPLPRIEDTVIFQNDKVNTAGKVYDVRHVITGNVAEIKIKVRE